MGDQMMAGKGGWALRKAAGGLIVVTRLVWGSHCQPPALGGVSGG